MVALVLEDLEQRSKSPGALAAGVSVRRLPNTPLILAIFVSFAFIFF
jgi:hypothetical protein